MKNSSSDSEELEYLDFRQNIHLYFNKEKGWILKGADGDFMLKITNDFYRIVSLLEYDFAEVEKSINSYLERNTLESRFPIEAVIQVGIRSKSDYWAGLALKWLSQVSKEHCYGLIVDLKTLIESKWAGQTHKQLADRELKRITGDGNA